MNWKIIILISILMVILILGIIIIFFPYIAEIFDMIRQETEKLPYFPVV